MTGFDLKLRAGAANVEALTSKRLLSQRARQVKLRSEDVAVLAGHQDPDPLRTPDPG